jgi:20S proteasome alpha/beta subunit
VTIIIGIKCKDSIVVASDSQTTSEGSKRIDTEKISILELADARVLVGQAGNSGCSGRALDILTEMARGVNLNDYRTVADMAWKAMRKVKDELREQNGGCDMEQLRDMIWKNEWQSYLLLAHFFKGDPYIFIVDLATGRADKENSHFAAIGSGANLGSYLLTEHTTPGMDASFASAIAVYVVETVIKHDAFCGGQTRVGVISKPVKEVIKEDEPEELRQERDEYFKSVLGYVKDDVLIFPQPEVVELAAIIAKLESSTRTERNAKLGQELLAHTKEKLRKIWNHAQATYRVYDSKQKQQGKP